jgi:DNA-directed RNA polymerase specialized sigma24 family protein
LSAELDETWAALWQLPSRQRAALVLRFYEDLTVPQVATALHCRLGTAKSLISRGLAALKEVLEGDD